MDSDKNAAVPLPCVEWRPLPNSLIDMSVVTGRVEARESDGKDVTWTDASGALGAKVAPKSARSWSIIKEGPNDSTRPSKSAEVRS
jgi:hypothetical protein